MINTNTASQNTPCKITDADIKAISKDPLYKAGVNVLLRHGYFVLVKDEDAL